MQIYALKFERHYIGKVLLCFPIVIFFFFLLVLIILQHLLLFKAEICDINIVLSVKKA